MLKKTVLVIAMLLIVAGPAFAKEAQKWKLVPKESGIAYTNTKLSKDPVPITTFMTDIAFDPSNLQGSRLNISADGWTFFMTPEEINIDKIKATENMGFVYPESPSAAIFVSKTIRRLKENSFVAEGTLQFYNKTRPLSFPFTVDMVEGSGKTMKIVLKGSFTVQRSDYTNEDFSKTGPNKIPVAFQLAVSTS